MLPKSGDKEKSLTNKEGKGLVTVEGVREMLIQLANHAPPHSFLACDQ